ncbi:hypothetical protein NLJ89_g8527 [Agrocybe chaxingu]|uniref:DUF6533 domain-containing protein n=1 Tax=Agrocybe chaxingu TaxID=84603 RepID=A0A9W8K2A7_9AGAR|nr:hypothetical protein NLJ89_g8527 [Agrocybe chaxingu]
MTQQSLLVLASGQIASLAFLVYEICLTFDDEVNVIWSKPNRSWIKWQFLFTRYFALSIQVINRGIDSAVASHMNMVSTDLKNWYMCQVIVGSILMSAVEAVLMARVYALYNKNVWIFFVFVIMILAEIVTVILGIVLNRPGDEFRASNILLRSPTSFTYFGIGAIASQITILGLTLLKYKAAVQGGWSKAPIMMLMVRDGTAAFFILLVVTTLTVVATSTQNEYAPIGNS